MKTAKKIPLPAAVGRFVEQQTTLPFDQLGNQAPAALFPYAEYWRRAIACMMLSERVRPKSGGAPNRTDANRLCKEANFNPYLFEEIGRFLVSAGIVDSGRFDSKYQPGEFMTAFWDHDLEALKEAARNAFLTLIQEFTGHRTRRPTAAYQSGLYEFTAVLTAAFRGLALNRDVVEEIFLEFSQLPTDSLKLIYNRLPDADESRDPRYQLDSWFDEKGQEAFRSALYMCDLAYEVEHQDKRWFCLSGVATVLFGLQEPPQPAPLPTDLKVQPDLSVFAGSGLPWESLVTLFRYCRVKRIDKVFEFQFEPKRLKEVADRNAAVEELRAALAPAGELPQTVEALFADKPAARGGIHYRACSALLKPENAEVLNAIREHPRLKGYLEPGAPKGYLLIKSESNPANFVARCKELGFNFTSR